MDKNKRTKSNTHVIKKQIINLQTNVPKSRVKPIQDKVLSVYKQKVLPQLERIFNKLVPKDVHIHLDKLVINTAEIKAESIQQELELQVLRQVEKILTEELIKKGIKPLNKFAKNSVDEQTAVKKDLLKTFLEDGTYPSWADLKNESAEVLLQELLEENPKAVNDLVLKLAKKPHVRRRLVYQFSPKLVDNILMSIYKKDGRKMYKQLQFIQKRLLQQYPAASAKKVQKLIQSGAFLYFLEQQKESTFKFKEREFNNIVIEHVQTEYKDFFYAQTDNTHLNSKVRPKYANTYQDLDILEYFLEHGSIPIWADVESKKTMQEIFSQLLQTRLIPLQKIVRKNIEKDYFLYRLVYQFEQKDIIKLLEPINSEVLDFIDATIETLSIFKDKHSDIPRSLSQDQIKTMVLTTALMYHFDKRKNNFIKQHFLQEVLEDIAPNLSVQTHQLIDVLKVQKSSISDTINSLAKKETLSKNKEAAEYNKALADFQQANFLLKEIQDRLANSEGLSADFLANLNQERLSLERRIAHLQKQQNSYLAKHKGIDETYLEWKALEQQKANISDNLNLLQEVNQSQANLAQRMEERLPILLQSIDKTIAQSPSQERTVSLQNLKKELYNLLNFFEDKHNNLQQTLQGLQAEINNAKNSKIRSKLRRRKKVLENTLAQQIEQLNKLQKTYDKLSTLVQDLTRITIKEGESMDNVGSQEDNLKMPSSHSKMDYLLYFLEFGAVPWWAEEYKDTSIENIFLEYIQKDSPSLKQGLTKMGRSAVLWQRLVHQLQDSTLYTLVEKLYKNNAAYALQHLDLLERIYISKILPDINLSLKEFKWTKIVEILLVNTSISKNKFTKELIKLTAQDFNIPPSILLRSMHNIIENIEEKTLIPLQNNIAPLQEDEELIILEEEINNALIRNQFLEEGLLLNDVDKIAIIQDYLSTGKLSVQAQNHKIKNVAQIENLLAQQIDTNADNIRPILANVLNNPRRSYVLAQHLSNATLWQIVEVLMPTAVLTLERYFKDLSIGLQDKKLAYEKGFMLQFVARNNNNLFDANYFVNELIDYTAQESGRTKLAISNEWKRKLDQHKTSSSLRLYVMAAELEALQKEAEETNLPTLKIQIEALNADYNSLAQNMYGALQRDAVEGKGIPKDKVSLQDIFGAQKQIQEQLDKVSQELSSLPKEAILEIITAKNKAAHYEAQLGILEKKIPAQIRLVREKLKDIAQNIAQINAEKSALLNLNLEDAPTEKPDTFLPVDDFEDKYLGLEITTRLNLLSEEKDEITDDLLQDLEKGIKRLLKNEETFTLIEIKQIVNKHSIFEELNKLLAHIPENKTAALEHIENDKIYDTVENILQKNGHISNQVRKVTMAQKSLLKQIEKADINDLFDLLNKAKDSFTDLSKLIDKDKNLSNNDMILEMLLDLDNQNKRIEKQVKAEQDARQGLKMKALQVTQKALFKRVKNATSMNTLLAITYDIDKSENEEIQALYDNASGLKKIEIEKQEKNIRKYFKRLRTRFIWQRAKLLQKQLQDYNAQLEQQQAEQKKLENEDKFLTKSFEKEEAQISAKDVEAENMAKENKRRKMLMPTSKPIEEPLFIKNAGLVILSPYLPRYFDVLGLVKNKMWVSIEAQYKGVHLLQYLANKQLETPENELVLNKIICGLPVNAPIPLTVEFTDAELKFSESLLQGAINNWARLKSMSPDAMRNTFLIRNGRLIEEADRWKVSVDKAALDVLLRTITWGFTFLRYPWFEKPIFVEWDYM